MTPDDKLFQLLVERLHGLERRADKAEKELHRLREEIGAVEKELSQRVNTVEKQALTNEQQAGFLSSKVALIMSWLAAAVAFVIAVFKDKLWP